MFFSVLTEAFNEEIVTNNLVSFKWLYGIKDENFYCGDSLKNLIFRGGGGMGCKKPIYRGESPKKHRLGQFADLRGCLAKKRGGGSWGGGRLMPQCVLWKNLKKCILRTSGRVSFTYFPKVVLDYGECLLYLLEFLCIILQYFNSSLIQNLKWSSCWQKIGNCWKLLSTVVK